MGVCTKIITSPSPRCRKRYERCGLAHASNMFLNPCSTFSVSAGCVLQCAVFPHNPVHHTLRSLLLFMHFLLRQSTTKSYLKHGPTTTYFLASSEAKTCKKVPSVRRLQRGPSGATPAGPPCQRGGGGDRGLAATTSALAGSSLLAYDAASTHCTG